MTNCLICGCAAVFAVAGLAHAAGLDVVFVDVGVAAGIQPYHMAGGLGGGVAASDFDNDGDIDLFVPNGLGFPDQLYRNLGGGVFEEIASAVGVASVENSRSALWLDYDNDGDLDLLVARDDQGEEFVNLDTTLILYQQTAPAQFVDVTVAAGLFADLAGDVSTHNGGLCAGDINKDGHLDICLAQWDRGLSLFLSDGDGTFTDITIAAGLGAPGSPWQPVMHDFNADGFIDIFIAHDFAANNLYINQSDNTFIDQAAQAGVDTAFNEMGVAIGDCDNDGDFDLYVTNLYRIFDSQQQHNVFFRNQTVGQTLAFTEIAQSLGVENGGFGWGTTFFDADRDGLPDLGESNSVEFPAEPNETIKLFHCSSEVPLAYENASAKAGFTYIDAGSSLIAIDIDRDGDLDLAQTVNTNGPLRLLKCQPAQPGPEPGFLTVRPRQANINTHAIGATVEVRIGAGTMTRLITAGMSFIGQEPAEAHFGLDAATVVDELTIRWPDGGVTTHTNIQKNRILTVARNCAADVSFDGFVGAQDMALLLGQWGLCAPSCAGDLSGDGLVGAPDLALMLGQWGSCF